MNKEITHSIYETAPDIMLDKIAAINNVLSKQKAKTGETESWKFWMTVSETMLFGWQYIQDLRFIIQKNRLLEQENKFLRDYCNQLRIDLEPYESIRRMMLNGKLEDTEKIVKELVLQGDKEIRYPQNSGSDE